MTSRTVTAVLQAPREDVFAYLAEVRNLPKWASEFARELRFVDGKPRVVNGLGEFFVRIDADRQSGVIDIFAGPSEDELALFPSRVVGLPGGGSAYTFTMFQGPETPDELFESQYHSLLREFEHIRETFG
jgi:hypothetical protein